VTLTAAATATKNLKIATGVCLVIQRDTIQTAKLVASLDVISGGRFLFGIGGGWNQEETADHGTVFNSRFKRMREQIAQCEPSGPRKNLNITARSSTAPR
jgi:alkanesulfonate monooxygenase SsuD/methylene tetrahydromethanopterin reductase-like flavin-dependent oxidoreductase (luciferase family)